MANNKSWCSIPGANVQTTSTLATEENYQAFLNGVGIFNAVFSPIAVSTNFLILVTLWKTPSLQSPSNILIASLALADLCVGIFLQPTLALINIGARHVPSKAFCLVFQSHMLLSYHFTALSLGTLTYLTLERFIALHWHLRYYELVTTKKVAIIVIQLWVFQAVMSAIVWFAIGSYAILGALSVTGAFGCILVICYSYMNIWKIVRQHRRRIQTNQSAAQEQNSQLDMFKYKARTYTFLLLLELFALCYFPYLCVEIGRLSRMEHDSIDIVEFSLLETFVFVNSSLNPVIYFWRVKNLRAAAWSTLKGMINACKND